MAFPVSPSNNQIYVLSGVKYVYDSTKTDAQNFVPFSFNFIYADTPIIQANNSIAITPVVVYNGGPNPTGFSVRLYDRTGNPTSSSYSWSVRGY